MNYTPERVVALVPIKAHSARVSGKNFRYFAGQPLCRWILETLCSLDWIDQVVINTDARDILASHDVRDSDRILIRDRPETIRGDLVSMNLVLANDIENVPADTYLMTHTTNPLLSARTIERAYETYRRGIEDQACDSLFTVNRIQTRFYRQDGSAVNHDPNNLVRTQDLEPWYEENSNLYVFSKRSFAETNARIGAKPMIFESEFMESFDIDDQTGWNLAELVAKNLQQGNLVG